MTTGDRSAILQTIRAFCEHHPTWVLFDELARTLLEVGSGKRLPLPAHELTEAVERQNTTMEEPYLLVELGDGREVALSSMGFAFAPISPNVPQAPPIPPVVCLADFRTIQEKLRHQAFDHPEEKLSRTVLDLMVLALGILEGARHIGLDISHEERQLEAVLGELEKRR